jgi:acyl-coenzyme A thioesterase PaaI-like protein
MSETASIDAVFIHDGATFEATELARGPWSPDSLHGGAPAALLMRAFEGLDGSGLAIARVTYEFVRPVPLGHLHVDAEVVRPGRRVQLMEGAIRTPGGTEVVRARALRVMAAHSDAPRTAQQPPPPGPEGGTENDYVSAHGATFARDALEIRFVEGAFYEVGPATAWFRLRKPIVAGERPSALQRLAAAGDFGNGIAATLPWNEYMFINPDLTLYIDRPPAGDWIGLESRMIVATEGIGNAESVLYDRTGRIGRAVQSLLVVRR